MQPDLLLLLLLLVKSRITFNFQIIIFADFIKPKPLMLIFKADHQQTFFHALMIQEISFAPFPRVLIFLILPRTLTKRPLYFEKSILYDSAIFETKYGLLLE